MITFWSVCVGGKYADWHVKVLKGMVERNLTVPFSFKCISDRDIPGVDCVRPLQAWPGWWSKINLFGMADGPSIFMDLDVIIAGNIDYLVEYTKHEIAAPANWAQSGHGGIQSSVLCWDGSYREPFEKFDFEIDSKRLWGDQEYLWELRGDDWARVPHIRSYKYHCRNGLDPEARIVAFHGEPKPWDVNDEWVKKSLSISTAA